MFCCFWWLTFEWAVQEQEPPRVHPFCQTFQNPFWSVSESSYICYLIYICPIRRIGPFRGPISQTMQEEILYVPCVVSRLPNFRIRHLGNSLEVQCRALCSHCQGPGVQSLVRELRSFKPCGQKRKESHFNSTLFLKCKTTLGPLGVMHNESLRARYFEVF